VIYLGDVEFAGTALEGLLLLAALLAILLWFVVSARRIEEAVRKRGRKNIKNGRQRREHADYYS
jgi:hypothetical protein